MNEESIFLKEYEGMELKPFKELDEPHLDPELTNKVLCFTTF